MRALAACGGLVAYGGLAACGGPVEVTPKSPFHGIHGLGFDNQGRLLAGSVVGAQMYEIDIKSGKSKTFIGPAKGQADDIAFAKDGTIAWTAFLEGKIYVKDPLRIKNGKETGGTIRSVAEGLPGLNSLDFAPDGRLYATQVFLGDALYEIDVAGKKKPRKIMEKMGGLNGFEIDKDGKLYGPLWFKGQVVQVDLQKAKIKVIAKGFKVPAAVNIDPQSGDLFVVDTQLGHVIRVDRNSGKKTIVAKVKPSIDNLAFDKSGRLFISNMADNAIIEINKKTGEAATITSGVLATACDIAIWNENGKDMLYVADLFAARIIDLETGKVSELGRMFGSREIDYPIHIDVSEKYIAMTGWSAGSVQVLDRKTKKSLALLHGFTTPHDVVILKNGDLLVAGFAKGEIIRLSGKKWAVKKKIATGFAGPAALLLSKDEQTLYIIEHTAGRLVSFDLKTRKKKIITQGLQGAEGIARLQDGRFIIAETKRQRIIAVDAQGNRETIAENLPINGLTADGGAVATVLPTGLAVGKNGDIYFSSDEFANIWKVTAK